MGRNKGISEAVIEIHKMSEDEKMERLEYLREKAILDGEDLRLTGYNQGRKDEKQELKIKMIKRLKEEGISDEKICDILEIEKEEFEKLLKTVLL